MSHLELPVRIVPRFKDPVQSFQSIPFNEYLILSKNGKKYS